MPQPDTPLFISRFDYTSRIVKPMTRSQLAARARVQGKINAGTYELTYVETCCTCSGSCFNTLALRDRYGMPVQTQICESCGTLLQNPRFTPDSLAMFYRDDYRELYSAQTPESLFGGSASFGSRLLEWITRNDVLRSTAAVLDAGCGSGGSLWPFQKAGYEVVGCDHGVDYLRHGQSVGLNLLEGGLDDISDRYEGYFDLVILQHVLEHTFDPLQFLHHVRRVSKDNGYVYVELHGIKNLRRSDYPDLLRDLQLAHNYYFDLPRLEAVMATAGFALVEGDESIKAWFQRRPPVKLAKREAELRKQLKGSSREIRSFIYRSEKLRMFLYLKNNAKLALQNPRAFFRGALFFMTHTMITRWSRPF